MNQEKLYEKFSIDLVGIKNLSSEEACEILHIEVSLKSMQGLLVDSCESLVSPKIFAALDGIPKKSYTFGIIKTFLVLNGDKINAVTTIFPALDGGFDCGYFSTKTIKVTDRLLVRGKNVLGIKSEAQIVNSSSVSNIVGSLVSILQFESNSTYIFAEKLTNMTFKKFQNGDEAWIHPLCPNIVLPKALELSLSDSWDCVVCGPRGILAIFDSEKVVILDMDAEEDSPDLDESEDIE